MKCPSCGRELKTGQLYCEHCGQEIQIVPDYDPLDELLIGREEPAEKAPDKPGKAEKAAESRESLPRRLTGKKKKKSRGEHFGKNGSCCWEAWRHAL